MAMIRPPQPYPMGLPMQSVPPPIARPPPPMPMPVSKSFLPSSMYTFYTNLSSLIASTLTFHLLCFSLCPSLLLVQVSSSPHHFLLCPFMSPLQPLPDTSSRRLESTLLLVQVSSSPHPFLALYFCVTPSALPRHIILKACSLLSCLFSIVHVLHP